MGAVAVSQGWSLIQAGRFEEAIEKLREEHAQHGSRGFLVNLGIAFLCKNDFKTAAKHFDDLVNDRPQYASLEYGLLGASKWLLAQPQEAITAWQEGLECEYTDGAGGIGLPLLLYFGSVRQPLLFGLEKATKLLRQRLKNPRAKMWPAPLARFLLDELSPQEVLLACAHTSDSVQRRREQMAEFYVGVRCLRGNDIKGYVDQMRRASQFSQCELNETFFLSRYETTLCTSAEN